MSLFLPQGSLFKFFLGTPLKLWASIGHWWIWHFDLSKYSEAQVRCAVLCVCLWGEECLLG